MRTTYLRLCCSLALLLGVGFGAGLASITPSPVHAATCTVTKNATNISSTCETYTAGWECWNCQNVRMDLANSTITCNDGFKFRVRADLCPQAAGLPSSLAVAVLLNDGTWINGTMLPTASGSDIFEFISDNCSGGGSTALPTRVLIATNALNQAIEGVQVDVACCSDTSCF